MEIWEVEWEEAWVQAWEPTWVEILGVMGEECSRGKETWAWEEAWVQAWEVATWEETNGLETRDRTLEETKEDLGKDILVHKSGAEIRGGTTGGWEGAL